MLIPLLSTKHSIPPAGARLVERRHLLQKLTDGFSQGKRLLLVCAPAGYGKSTLVGAWVHQITTADQPNPGAAWLACDAEDNDTARFLSYLVAALRQVDPRIGEGLLASFHASKIPAPKILATLLINDLARIPERFVLVLDDFHTITSQAVRDFLAYLIEHQPPMLCLVLVTRADPDLPLARLRGKGQLEEIRQDELSFTQEEAADFLNHSMGLALTGEQLLALEKRTEGWAAGLQLAALSMRSTQDVPAFIEAFSGGYDYIADYLADEVLSQQPESIQSFLLQTSILERLSAPLCAAVSGEALALDIMEILREKNLFLVPLDHHKEWYRYHALFADLLRNRLNQTRGDLVNELHLRASRWYEEHGLLIPAVEHAFSGQAYEQAAGLLEQALEPIFISGQIVTLLRWLDTLPDGVKNRHPLFWIYHGLALIWAGKSSPAARSGPFLPALDALFTDGGLIGEAHMLQALVSMSAGKPLEADQLAQSALQELPAQRALFRCLAADTLGMVKIMQSDTAGAIEAFEQTVEIASQAGYAMFEIVALSHLAGLRLQQGRLRAAEIGYRRALELSAIKMGKGAPVTGNALLGQGELAREWNDLDGALRCFSESAALFAQFSDFGLPIAHLSMARVKAAQGDWRSAQETLETARRYAQASKATALDDRLVDGLQAKFWIMQGELGLAEQWAHERGLIEHPLSEVIQTSGRNAAGSEFVYSDYLTLARLYLAQNKVDAALQVLESLLDLADSMGYMRRVIQILVVKAAALQRKKANEAAVEALGQALALAEAEGYQRVFLDEGEGLVTLLYLASAQGYSSAYAKKLLAAFGQAGQPSAADEKKTSAGSLLEPLSQREIEVLALIAEGLSNGEIAVHLTISLSTVKGHTASIYGKLGVNSRTRAVSEAVRLGILHS